MGETEAKRRKKFFCIKHKAHILIEKIYRYISISIRSNKMQQYTGINLLQNRSKCFGCPSHPSSGVHKTVIAASGTGHSI